MRTKKPLDLFFAPCMWKLVAGMTLTIEDLEEVRCITIIMHYLFACIYYVKVDLMFVRALIGIRDIDKSGVKEDEFSEVRTGQTSTRHVTCTILLLWILK